MSRPSVLTIGNFDGVHLGHRAILARARQIADRRGARVIVLTFDPHPIALLRPGSQPPKLSRVVDRVETLTAAGADIVHLLKPDAEFLSQAPEQFADRIVREFHPVAVVEGPDFHFGKGRAGDLNSLRELGRARGFEVEAVPGVEVTLSDCGLTQVSSSLTRWLVGRGRVADAAVCLGQPFQLTATVVKGDQRGRTIGVPTANLHADQISDLILPADGVYAGEASLGCGMSHGVCGMSEFAPSDIPHTPSHIPHLPTFPAAISVGVKPTFAGKRLTVEAHLIGYAPDDPDEAYGRTVTLRFARWLRDQYSFPSLDHLVAQLHRDIARTSSMARIGTPTHPHTLTTAGAS